jgi:hypothetical protein
MVDFADGVAERLPPDVPVPNPPTLSAILADLDPLQYVTYKMASQYTHGTHEGGTLYRRNLGTAKTFAERVEPSQWADPMRMCWWALRTGLTAAVATSGGNADRLVNREIDVRVDGLLAALSSSSSEF